MVILKKLLLVLIFAGMVGACAQVPEPVVHSSAPVGSDEEFCVLVGAIFRLTTAWRTTSPEDIEPSLQKLEAYLEEHNSAPTAFNKTVEKLTTMILRVVYFSPPYDSRETKANSRFAEKRCNLLGKEEFTSEITQLYNEGESR